jgi:hypothetical protein
MRINKDTLLTVSILSPVVEKWKKILGLSGWDLSLAICSADSMNERISSYNAESLIADEIVLGCVTHCYTVEQVATIQFMREAPKHFGVMINIDTLVCHELIHVLVRAEFDRLPKAAQKSKRLGELEEFIADRFSYIMFKAIGTTYPESDGFFREN